MGKRGIPIEASYPIRRAIAERGTVARKSYGGFEVMAQAVDMVSEEVLDEIEYGYDRVMRSMQ